MQSDKKSSGRVYPGLYESQNGSVWMLTSERWGIVVYSTNPEVWNIGEICTYCAPSAFKPYEGSVTLRN